MTPSMTTTWGRLPRSRPYLLVMAGFLGDDAKYWSPRFCVEISPETLKHLSELLYPWLPELEERALQVMVG